MSSSARWRLAVLNSHPIQYFAPFYARLARESDFDVTVFYCSQGGVAGYADVGFGQKVRWDIQLLEGYRHEFLWNATGGDAPGGFWSLVNPGIVRRLLAGGYDAIWIHGHNYFTTLLALAAAKLSGIPILMRADTHLLLRRGVVKRWIRIPVLSALYGLCDACLVIGSRNADFYRRIGVPDRKLFLVPYSVDNHFFGMVAEMLGVEERRDFRENLGLPSEVPVVLFVGKLVPQKRPADLLAAYGRLRSSGMDAALVFAGSGELESSLRDTTRQLGIPGVHFLGFQNQTELARLYAASDILVLPSENESWGLVINEAMAAGLPVVATREAGASADLVKDGRNGFAFETGDVAELLRYLALLVTDIELRHRMGDESRRIIKRWSYDEGVAGIRAVLAAFAPRSSEMDQDGG